MNGTADAVHLLQVDLWDFELSEEDLSFDVSLGGLINNIFDGHSLDGLVFC